jgi:siroheme synthase-like protein
MLYPINLKVQGRRCVIVGGGSVAFQKARALARVGADLLMVSPRFDRSLRGVKRRRGEFRVSDLKGAFLVIAATDRPEINARIKKLCDRMKILVNVVDRPELCTFYAPSVVRRGPFMLAISTDGLAPGFSKTLRRELEQLYPAEFGRLVSMIGKLRKKIRNEDANPKRRLTDLNQKALKLWRRKGLRGVRRALK